MPRGSLLGGSNEEGAHWSGRAVVGVRRRMGRWRQLGQEVTGDEGVDVDELCARAVLLKVVTGPEVHG
jgi:hypothetical protein